MVGLAQQYVQPLYEPLLSTFWLIFFSAWRPGWLGRKLFGTLPEQIWY
jgi:hypothetical protein